MKNTICDTLSEVLLEAKVIDRPIQTIPWDDAAGVVHGVKDGIHVAYRVWFDDDDKEWQYEPND